jgi:hypothetical protein
VARPAYGGIGRGAELHKSNRLTMGQGPDKRRVSLIDFLESEPRTLKGSFTASEIMSIVLAAEARR